MRKNTAEELLQKVKKDYNSISKSFHQTRKHSWREFEEYLQYIKNAQNILDLGCGNGRFYKFLEEKGIEASYTGIDNSEGLIKHARESNPEANFKMGDMLQIPSENSKYDSLVCIAAFHHLPNKELREKALQEIKRVTKQNGTIIISVWNLFQKRYKKFIWKARIKKLLSFGKYHSRDTFIPWGKTGIERYYYAFTQAEMRQLLEDQNLKVLKEITGNNFVFICQKS